MAVSDQESHSSFVYRSLQEDVHQQYTADATYILLSLPKDKSVPGTHRHHIVGRESFPFLLIAVEFAYASVDLQSAYFHVPELTSLLFAPCEFRNT